MIKNNSAKQLVLSGLRITLLACTALLTAAASAEQVSVQLERDADRADVDLFLSDWGSVGVRTLARRGGALVLELPDDLSAADLAKDPLVMSIDGPSG